jgi:5-methylcytosine-specific restriction enzyme subunit McrC
VSRLNQRFQPLLNLARLFLDNSALQLASGDLSAFAFVFDMNRVFERFLVNFIRKHRDAILPSSLRGCDLLPQSRGTMLYMATIHDKPLFGVRPDLSFRDGEVFPLLLDAKYKALTPNSLGYGVSQDDFNQMFAYAHRYHCAGVLVLYPQTADMAQPLHERFLFDDGSQKTLTVATVDLRLNFGSPQGRAASIQRLNSLFAAEEQHAQRQ